MKNNTLNIFLLLCMFSFVYSKLYNGIGIQMSLDGAGIYYKQFYSLTDNSQLLATTGLHFENSQIQEGMFYTDNNYEIVMLDIAAGYRNELLSDHIVGHFRPISIIEIGGISNLKSFSSDNIAGIWMIKYNMGFGVCFYNRGMFNEITIRYIQSNGIKGNGAFELVFYWK